MHFVDTHAHVFNTEGPFIPTARYTPSYEATLETFLANLDKHNLHYGVLIQPSFYGTDNSFMLKAVEQSKGRLKAVVVVSPDIDTETLQQYHQQGVCGIRLNLFGLEIPNLLSSEWAKLINTISKMGWHIELHCPPSYLLSLLPVLQNYTIRVVIDHLGRPSADQNLDDDEYQLFLSLLNPAQHWIKLSGLYRIAKTESASIAKAQRIIQELKGRQMINNIVWGSDWPHTQHEHESSYEQNWALLTAVINDEHERQLILGENALKLFNF
ncbi:MAG: amidohydrolase family protein [Pelistega sp.]|nr:amidohydrolase family protein [Pelistega sp.]